MSEEVVSSFPTEDLAAELRDALVGNGIPAQVGYAGPRAYPVYVDERDADAAGNVLLDSGYLVCQRSLSMGSVWEFNPDDPRTEEEILEVKSLLEEQILETVQAHAEIQAAEAWSTPNDDQEAQKMVIVATFGDAEATNGELGPPNVPEGYVQVEGGGEVPVAEEHVDLGIAMDVVMEQPEFEKYSREVISDLLGQIRAEKYPGTHEVTTTVSGETVFYKPGGKHGG